MRVILIFLIVFSWTSLLGQGLDVELGFDLGDTLYLYEATDIGAEGDYVNVDFYSNYISCVKRLYVENPEVPQVSFQITDDKGNGELYRYDDGILYLKGFLGEDPFFKIQHSFIQFKGEIPLAGIPSSHKAKQGETSAFLEYQFKELPAPFPIWGQINEYKKIRLQLSIQYVYENHGDFEDLRFADLDPEEISLSYAIEVKSIEVLKEGWESIDASSHPDLKVALSPKRYQSFSLHHEGRGFFFQRNQVQPENAVQFLFTEPRKYVPDCMASEAGVYVFPNPTFGDLNLKIDDPSDSPYKFYLYDIVGNELWHKTFELTKEEKTASFLLPYFRKGIYLYAIKDSRDIYLQSRRLVIVEH